MSRRVAPRLWIAAATEIVLTSSFLNPWVTPDGCDDIFDAMWR